VLLVIAYHFKLGPFHGGLIGVDVFFVLSGFLITSLLLRELQSTNTISLSDFWARRVRRLLPASALVIVATLIAARSLLSPIQLRSVGHDALAAATFVINLVLGRRSNDYLGAQAAEASPSPLLHFWSLALEEQFYVVWPVVILLVSRYARDRIRAITATVATLGAASLLACLYFTSRSPIWAFYLLPTRAWELLAGAGLALVGARVVRIPEQTRALIGWLGIGGIVVASLVISDSTVFPGYAALLPVLATVAVVGIGGASTRNGPIMLLRARPLQWVGKRSYAIYLWHWPVFILADAKWGPLTLPQRIGALAVTGSLATISYILVEDPVRHAAWLAAHARRTLAVGACLVALASVAAVLTYRGEVKATGEAVAGPDLGLDDPEAETTERVDSTAPPATDNGAEPTDTTPPDASGTPTTASATVYSLETLIARNDPIVDAAIRLEEVPSNLTPSFGRISKDLPSIYGDGCLLDPGQTEAGECTFGDPNSTTKVALVGDSHAAQWFPAVEEAAKRRGWRLVVLVKKGCAMAEFVTYDEANRKRAECAPWRKKVLARLEAEQPNLILAATYRYRLTNRPARSNARQQWLAALTPTLKTLRKTTDHLVFLGDIPHPESWPATCLSNNMSSARDCLMDRSKAERRPVLEAEVAAAKAADATYVKVSDWMCNLQQCAVMLGNIQLYRDDNHIGATASRYFLPFIEAVTVPLLEG
jgi:peptidoglycan/LPS O-acetylase OafA/YrhL